MDADGIGTQVGRRCGVQQGWDGRRAPQFKNGDITISATRPRIHATQNTEQLLSDAPTEQQL